jgi:hypothetical protein
MQVEIGEHESAAGCACGTPLEHWQKYSAVPLPSFCYVMACPGTPVVGVEVRTAGGQGEAWYVVPLCIEHAARMGEALELIPGAQLVLAKPRRTCRMQGVRF